MKIRTMQIWGFLLSVLGWIFVSCSLAMEAWKISSVGGQGGNSIISVAWYWSSLWRACFTDSSSTTNCYDFPVLWSVEGYLQIVRALLMSGMGIGVLGFILSLVGMECTYIGGKEKEKNRHACSGGICHVTSGMLAAAGYTVYAERVSAEYFNPRFDGLEFALGTPLFLGWAGCAFQIAGGIFFIVSVCRNSYSGTLSAPVVETNALRTSRTNISIVSELSTKSKTSTISEISEKSGKTAASKAQSKTSHVSRGDPARSQRSDKSRASEGSEGVKSESYSRSTRTNTSYSHNKKSFPSRGTTHQFIKNSYL